MATLGVTDRFTADELAQFERDGFLVVRGMVGADAVARMREVTREGLSRAIEPLEFEADLQYPGAPQSRDRDGGHTIRRLKMAIARDPVFMDVVTGSLLSSRLQQLFDGPVAMPLAHHNCIMTKRPQFSSDTGWHQDSRYWNYESTELISVWIALGKEYPRNGGLYVIPGTHRMEIRRDRLDEALFLDGSLPENAALIEKAVPVELSAGDVLLFHCNTFHSASRNNTDEEKYSVVFTFRPTNNRPIAGSRSASLPDLILPVD